MASIANYKKLLDLKRWEQCAPLTGNTGTGSIIVSSPCHRQLQLYMANSGGYFIYDPYEDGWTSIPSSNGPALGSGQAGACMMLPVQLMAGSPGGFYNEFTMDPYFGTWFPARDLRGYKVICVSATYPINQGQVRTIASNDESHTFKFTEAFPDQIMGGDIFEIYIPRFFVTQANNTLLKYYDFATNTWGNSSNLPYSPTQDGRLVATPNIIRGEFKYYDSGTCTSTATGTITDSSKTWAGNQWVNYAVRITAGAGAGTTSRITASGATTLTLANTSVSINSSTQYVIEADCTALYALPNSTASYRLRMASGGTINSTSSSFTRPGSASTGMNAHWLSYTGDSAWGNVSNIKDGRYIYSCRGNGSVAMDIFDIATSSWSSVNLPRSVNLGSLSAYYKDNIYLSFGDRQFQKFNVVTRSLEAFAYLFINPGSSITSETAFVAVYEEDNVKIPFFYVIPNSAQMMYRINAS